VIDFHGDSKADAKPKGRPILEFVAGGRQLSRVLHENCLPVAETMKMVNEATEQRSYWPGYDLITNNCETFATYEDIQHRLLQLFQISLAMRLPLLKQQ